MVTKETDVPSDSAPPEPGKPKKAADRTRLLVVLGVVVVAAVVFFLANRNEDPEPAAKGGGVEFVNVEDREGRYTIDLPTTWQLFEQQQEDPQIRMVVGEPGTQNNLRVRVSPLPQPVVINQNTPDTVLAELQAQFDKYIDDGQNVREVIQRQRVNINGLQGWWYLYSFNDDAGNEEGFHSHFFLLGGDALYVLVFQTLPASDYPKYASTFDKMIASFKLLPDRAPSPSPAG